MTSIFDLNKNGDDDDIEEKINIDELYEKKRTHDLGKLSIYKKILNRVHVKIKTTSRQHSDNQNCWYVVPEIIIGVPRYDQGNCIAYLLDKLRENGFVVRYIHPNCLFISWNHWVPSYVRSEIKKKTGVEVDEYGNVKKAREGVTGEINNNPNNNFLIKSTKINIDENKNKNFKPTTSYKPLGNFIYNDKITKPFSDK